jgi:hypothetical protein
MNITMRKYALSTPCELLSNQQFIHSDCVDVRGELMLSSLSPQCACRTSDPPSPKETRSLCIPSARHRSLVAPRQQSATLCDSRHQLARWSETFQGCHDACVRLLKMHRTDWRGTAFQQGVSLSLILSEPYRLQCMKASYRLGCAT